MPKHQRKSCSPAATGEANNRNTGRQQIRWCRCSITMYETSCFKRTSLKHSWLLQERECIYFLFINWITIRAVHENHIRRLFGTASTWQYCWGFAFIVLFLNHLFQLHMMLETVWYMNLAWLLTLWMQYGKRSIYISGQKHDEIRRYSERQQCTLRSIKHKYSELLNNYDTNW